MFKNKIIITVNLLFFSFFYSYAQSTSFSPYSRYGLGEITASTFAHQSSMGGTYIALKPDSTMPIFINAANPAAYSLIRYTTLEVGGNFLHSQLSNNSSSQTNYTSNFSYGAIGFPVRSKGGACFGIMPYSEVGYQNQNTVNEIPIGLVNYKFEGSGGLNKFFIGYGIAPFNNRLIKFKTKQNATPLVLKNNSFKTFYLKQFGNKLLSDLSFGLNVNYIFGNIQNNTRVVYPNSQLYNNTFRSRILSMGDFNFNFGVQTAITIDSIKQKINRRVLKEKVKITFGYFLATNNALKVNFSTLIYNYSFDGYGQEVIRDTVLHNLDQIGSVVLPLEQGIGVGFKKADRINVVADFALTNWQNFRYLQTVNYLKDNYRVSFGVNYVPEKYAAGKGAFLKRVNYRLGASYQSGFINIKNTMVSNYFVSAGVGLPVGISHLSSMINLSIQYGKTSPEVSNLYSENYWRLNFGFTFTDRWFQKFKYD